MCVCVMCVYVYVCVCMCMYVYVCVCAYACVDVSRCYLSFRVHCIWVELYEIWGAGHLNYGHSPNVRLRKKIAPEFFFPNLGGFSVVFFFESSGHSEIQRISD